MMMEMDPTMEPSQTAYHCIAFPFSLYWYKNRLVGKQAGVGDPPSDGRSRKKPQLVFTGVAAVLVHILLSFLQNAKILTSGLLLFFICTSMEKAILEILWNFDGKKKKPTQIH